MRFRVLRSIIIDRTNIKIQMPLISRNCPHIANRGDLAFIEIVVSQKEKFKKCSECDTDGPNLWLCLFPDCRWVGCPETHLDHSIVHNQKFPNHCAHMNLSTNRIWCYSCKREVITRHVPSPPVSPTQVDIKPQSNKFAGDASINIDCKTDDLNRLILDK